MEMGLKMVLTAEHHHWRFNWATSFQTWKSGTSKTNFANEFGGGFQLGHVFSDMEIRNGRNLGA